MNSQKIKGILQIVDRNINSNTILQLKGGLINPYFNKRKLIKELQKTYPSEKVRDTYNLLTHFSQLYSDFRSAQERNDQPRIHRFLTSSLYEKWKQEKGSFILYPMVYNIQLIDCGNIDNSYGKWVQCMIKMSHKENSGKMIAKTHIVQRKLVEAENYKRGWYFCQFQN